MSKSHPLYPGKRVSKNGKIYYAKPTKAWLDYVADRRAAAGKSPIRKKDTLIGSYYESYYED